MSGARRPSLATIVRLAVSGGRADALRITLTVFGSFFATTTLLLAVLMGAITTGNGPYSSSLLEPSGLVVFPEAVLVILALIGLAFVGQCSRIGAPARDRRIAAIRMAGGTPGNARSILGAETFCAAAVGALLAGGLYMVMHQWFPIYADQMLDDRGIEDFMKGIRVTRGLVLPTDVVLHPLLFLAVLLAVPIGATVLGLLALRRAALTPFGVTRREAHRPPTTAPLVLCIVGVLGLAGVALLPRPEAGPYYSRNTLVAIGVCFLCTGVGVIFVSASLAYYSGRFGATRTSRPAVLIACRRMVDAPFTASRASAAVVLMVLVAAAAQAFRASILLMSARQCFTSGEVGKEQKTTCFTRPAPDLLLMYNLIDLAMAVAIGIAVAALLVVAAEGIVTRRRTLAALVAAGVPRRTLAFATLIEVIGPLVPAVLVAAATGLLGMRYLLPTNFNPGVDGFDSIAVPIPWVELGVLVGGTLLAATAITALSLLFLRRATDLTELRTAA